MSSEVDFPRPAALITKKEFNSNMARILEFNIQVVSIAVFASGAVSSLSSGALIYDIHWNNGSYIGSLSAFLFLKRCIRDVDTSISQTSYQSRQLVPPEYQC